MAGLWYTAHRPVVRLSVKPQREREGRGQEDDGQRRGVQGGRPVVRRPQATQGGAQCKACGTWATGHTGRGAAPRYRPRSQGAAHWVWPRPHRMSTLQAAWPPSSGPSSLMTVWWIPWTCRVWPWPHQMSLHHIARPSSRKTVRQTGFPHWCGQGLTR